MEQEITGRNKFTLNGPPPQPEQRAATPEALYDSSSGTVTASDEAAAMSDRGMEQVALAFQLLATAEDALTQLSGIVPPVLPVCSDMIAVLRQSVPQALAAMQATTPMAQAGTPMMQQLAGAPAPGAGGGAGQPPSPEPIAGPSPMAAPPGVGGVMR